MLSHGNCFKKNSNPEKSRSKLPETFTHGKMCYSKFSKNTVKNITFVATRKPTKKNTQINYRKYAFLYA